MSIQPIDEEIVSKIAVELPMAEARHAYLRQVFRGRTRHR